MNRRRFVCTRCQREVLGWLQIVRTGRVWGWANVCPTCRTEYGIPEPGHAASRAAGRRRRMLESHGQQRLFP